MATKLVCARCGYEPEWTAEQWGRHPETHGHGPEPVCTNLVPDHRFVDVPLTPNGGIGTPGMRCGGTLVPAKLQSSRKGD